MNLLLASGLLLMIGYLTGNLLDKVGIPKIIGYIATGIAFSPNTMDMIDLDMVNSTEPLMQVCLAFITFEVGGALKWSKIFKREREIINITLLASIFPMLFITGGVFVFGKLFPELLPFDSLTLFLFSLSLGALAAPTEPVATLAVMHEYKAKGKVSETVLGVAALDDAVGILLFSITLSVVSFFNSSGNVSIGMTMLHSLYQIFGAAIMGIICASILNKFGRLLKIKLEGQWIVFLSAMIVFCAGLSQLLGIDELLAVMTMGFVVVNWNDQQELIFGILEKYTEDLIFLVFFLLSGLHLNISTIPQAAVLIGLFVLLRTAGKYTGTGLGARISGSERSVRKYTAGGLLPQGGIVIGLVLSIYGAPGFEDTSELLLTSITGATVIHELIGPLAAKYSLTKAGEIKTNQNSPT